MSSRTLDTIQTAGVNDVYNYIEIHLDTQFCDNRPESQTDKPHTHPEWTLAPPVPDVLGVKLLTAQIPFSSDVVNSTNNTFSTDVDTYSLPVGNYNVQDLVAELNKLTIDPGNANAAYLEWSYVARTGSLSVRSTDQQTHSLVLDDNAPLGIFGIAAPATFTITPAGISLPGVVNVSGPNYFLLTSRAIASRIHTNIRTNGSTTTNPLILAKIPNTVNPGGVILYTDPSPGYAFDMNLDQLTTVDLQLLDGNTLEPVAMKAFWSVTLLVLTQRDTTIARNRDVPQKSGPAAKRIRVR